MVATAVQSPAAPPPETQFKSAYPGSRLLLVEDQEVMRSALTFILKHWGYEIHAVNNGLEAVAAVRNQPVDLMLSDLQTPLMDGLRATMLLRRDPRFKRLPVMFITQCASADVIGKAAALGVIGLIVKKNYTAEYLFQRIESALDRTQQWRIHLRTQWGKSIAAAGARKQETAQPEDPAQQAIDADEWKRRISAAGRQEREETRRQLQAANPPVIFGDLSGELGGLLAEPNVDTRQLSRLLMCHPPLAIKTIQAANAAGNNASGWIDHIPAAIEKLHPGDIKTLHQGLAQLTLPTPRALPWARRWWRHSWAVCCFAGALAPSWGVCPGTAATAGFLHDIGRLALLCGQASDRVVACYELASQMIIPTNLAEQMLLGINHQAAGAEFCRHLKLPPSILSACLNHCLDDAMLGKLQADESRLSMVITTADQIAKSAGFSGLVNDELLPLPPAIASTVEGLDKPLEEALHEAGRYSAYRLGKAATELTETPISLQGMRIALMSGRGGAWNPCHRLLTGAGAAVTPFAVNKTALDALADNDLLVIDQTGGNLATLMPQLRRLCLHPALQPMPKLLMARRSEDPEAMISQSNLPIVAHPTPIRSSSLLKAIWRLAN